FPPGRLALSGPDRIRPVWPFLFSADARLHRNVRAAAQHEAPRQVLGARDADAGAAFDLHGRGRLEKCGTIFSTKIAAVIDARHSERLGELAGAAAQPDVGF